MGNVRPFNMGLRHGRFGVVALAHRHCRLYDSRSATKSYYDGYRLGAQERKERYGECLIEPRHPLNQRLGIRVLPGFGLGFEATNREHIWDRMQSNWKEFPGALP